MMPLLLPNGQQFDPFTKLGTTAQTVQRGSQVASELTNKLLAEKLGAVVDVKGQEADVLQEVLKLGASPDALSNLAIIQNLMGATGVGQQAKINPKLLQEGAQRRGMETQRIGAETVEKIGTGTFPGAKAGINMADLVSQIVPDVAPKTQVPLDIQKERAKAERENIPESTLKQVLPSGQELVTKATPKDIVSAQQVAMEQVKDQQELNNPETIAINRYFTEDFKTGSPETIRQNLSALRRRGASDDMLRIIVQGEPIQTESPRRLQFVKDNKVIEVIFSSGVIDSIREVK